MTDLYRSTTRFTVEKVAVEPGTELDMNKVTDQNGMVVAILGDADFAAQYELVT